MRKTAITTMLCLGMPENLVRKISGHAPGSKDFFRYVQLSQKYMDNETEKIFEILKNKTLLQH
jgi:intergrase/recombinase